MYDILINNGRYPDFEINQLILGDVAILGGKIEAVGQIDSLAKTVIDAAGCIVSPGFIDIHMHEEYFDAEGPDYVISKLMLQMGVTTAMGGNCGVIHQDLDHFQSVINKTGGSPIHYRMMSGYNTFRGQLGIDRYKPASKEQIDLIIDLIREDLSKGAYGISFGLEYDPGITFDEVMQVLNAFPDDNLFVSMHFRSDSIDGVKEMIRYAVESKKRFQISHLSSCAARGNMEEALALNDQAVFEYPNLDFDTYPYDAVSTRIGSAVFDGDCFQRWKKDYDCIYVPSGKYKNQFCTKAMFDELRRDDPDRYIVAFTMNEEEIAAAIAHPSCGMVASDGQVKERAGHPRAAGTFPRILGKYVREEQVISLIDALRKMTLTPANRLELYQKGRIEPGCDADITIFDPQTVCDGATFQDLFIQPTGIPWVIINGTIAVQNGEMINVNSGHFIKGPYTTEHP